ncbi:MAG: cell envelope integrity protein CreD [Bacteroidetes bacterium]|nr:MAG: cell envelope integrity protein CreD [Bacteroidota bacterium]
MELKLSDQNWSANRITLKGLVIGFLTLVLLIPTLFIMSLVSERAGRQKEVAAEVSSKWATAQNLIGPILVIPYTELIKTEDGKANLVKKFAYFLPEQLNIDGTLQPEMRHRSIYNIAVYKSQVNISGSFPALNFQELNIPRENLILNEAQICFGISDFKGIEEQLNLNFNNTQIPMNSGTPNPELFGNGVNAAIPVALNSIDKSQSFAINLHLKGSEKLYFTPVGKTTKVHMTSSWTTPSFDGNFIPLNSTVNEKGFSADWQVQNLNRNYPQSWKDAKFDIDASAFGVNLLQPVDSYSMTTRSVKYAILFIALSFALYFFIEIVQKRNIHPAQYVLVGLALCVFYTLLLSISEYLPFSVAYITSTIATVTLITTYSKTLFGSWKIALMLGFVLLALYGFIYVLIQLQDGALIFGSIGLFVLLAIIMYYSRKIDWQNNQQKQQQVLA